MMAKEKISALIFITLAAPGLTLAADNSNAPQTAAAMDEVVVTAARVSESLREVSADVMVIDADDDELLGHDSRWLGPACSKSSGQCITIRARRS